MHYECSDLIAIGPTTSIYQQNVSIYSKDIFCSNESYYVKI